MEVVLLNNPKN